MALPRVPIPASCLTEKDRADLRFGIEHGVDFVAVSFVRSAADIEEVRAFLRELGADIPIVAKLERQEVIGNLPEILPIVDAVMVARGDLGVDVPLEEVPHIQKEVIRQARAARVPVIVATQMLESMTTHARPTRAEVADVTAAIFDGADAIMLSAETASGRFPAQAVDYMARIAARAEEAVVWRAAPRRRTESPGFPETISSAAATAAHDLDARAIVAFTETGFSARLISQERPGVPIIALTPHPTVLRRLALCWGVTARVVRKVEGTDEMIDEIEAALLGDGIVRAGRRHRHHLRRAHVGAGHHQSPEAPPRGRARDDAGRNPATENAMAYQHLIVERAAQVATITLNRPEALNALDLALGRELFHAALEVDEDPAIRCVVVTGAGKAFCAGGDVKGFADNLPRIGVLIKELTTYLHGAVSRLCRSDKPVIMAVNGVAAGGGFSLALSGDLVVAAESARFTMAYSKIAATPDGSSSYFLPRLIGLRRALELYVSNRVLSAREALEWGLVTRVVPDAEFKSRRRRAGPRAGPGAHQGIRGGQAPLPPVDVGESRDADGAGGASHRRQWPHPRLRRRGDGLRQQADADLRGTMMTPRPRLFYRPG